MFLAPQDLPSAELKREPKQSVMVSMTERHKTLTDTLHTQIRTRSKGTQILGGH